MGCAGADTVIVAKGPRGRPGSSGSDGTNGTNAYTTTTAAFTVPGELGTVNVKVDDTSWMQNDMLLQIGNQSTTGAGVYKVISIVASTEVQLRNMEDTPNGKYPDNEPPATVIPTAQLVIATGAQGTDGNIAGVAAGGDLDGNYPNPTLGVLTTKGDIMGFTTVHARLGTGGVGNDGKILHALDSAASGLAWQDLDLSGANTSLSGQLPIASGGTGASAKAAAFDALSPMTTNGDLTIRSGGTGARLAIGTAGQILTVSGGLPAWAAATSSDSIFEVRADAAASPITIANLSDTTKMGLIVYRTVAGSPTYTLPDATSFGEKWLILRYESGAILITISANDAGFNPVRLAANHTTSAAYGGIVFYCDGSNWTQLLVYG